jgi:hypothetical protein
VFAALPLGEQGRDAVQRVRGEEDTMKEPTYKQGLLQEHITDTLLQTTLEATVPFRMLELRQWGGPTEGDWEEARAFADVLAFEGDALLFKGHKQDDTARVMRGLIRALAVMAFVPGGVTAWGLHFDAGTPDSAGLVCCSTLSRFDRADADDRIPR